MYMGSESMHFPPPSPTKPQQSASLDVFSSRVVSRAKNKSTEARPESVQVKPLSVKPAGGTRNKESGSWNIHGTVLMVDLDWEKDESNGHNDRRDKQQHRPQRPTGCMDVLTNLLGCRGSEAVSSVLVPVARVESGGTNKRRGREGYANEGNGTNFRKSRGSDRGENKASTMAKYKPVGAPKCSQCGRRFNPEKLHSHMKSCKVLKARAKRSGFVDAATLRTESNRTTEPSSQEFSRESIAGLLM